MTKDNSTAGRWLVSPDWLAERLKRPDVVAVDASYPIAGTKRDMHAAFREGHIPGAVFFDIDAIADHSSELPHMLPGPAGFGDAVGKLGIARNDTIVVYDSSGLYSAARVWWTFRIFGAPNVYILDGGLPAWKAGGRPLETGDGMRAPKTFEAEMNTRAVANVSDVQMALMMSDGEQVVDARAHGRFIGKDPEPRPGLRSGHMPGAHNVPFAGLIENGRLKPPAELAKAFAAGGVDLDKPVITSCGSGLTAAILTLALETLGKNNGRIYDGSWTEWAGRPDLPIETG